MPRVSLDAEACGYTIISRIIDRKWLFDTPERRDKVTDIIRDTAILKGVRLLNYTVMSNHLHILGQIISEQNQEPLTKQILLRQAKVLYQSAYVNRLKNEFRRAEKIDAKAGDKWHSQQILERYESKRGCLSEFMKEVKERTADYINKQHKRTGIVWDGRFKSPIVQNTPEALLPR